MNSMFGKLWRILTAKEKKLAVIVLLVNLFVAFIEVLGVASIMPFIAILSNPEMVFTNKILNTVYEFFGYSDVDEFLFLVGGAVLSLMIFSIVVRILGFMTQVNFAAYRNYSIATRLMSEYINRPYSWFLDNHSSELATKILSEISRVVHEAMFPVINVISQGFVVTLLLVMLIVLDPFLAISTGVFLCSCYILIYIFANKKMRFNGEVVRVSNLKRFKVTNEAFSGIKEVKIRGLEEIYIDQFRSSSKNMATHTVSTKVLSEVPSFVMQGLVFSSLIFFLLYLMKDKGSLNDALPMISLYAFAGYRLMPGLQSIYNHLSVIKFAETCVNALYEDIEKATESRSNKAKTSNIDNAVIPFNHSLELRDLVFTYRTANSSTLNSLSLTIKKNSVVGFVGGSGAGKTTIADILLGLLTPEAGGIYLDGQLISGAQDMKRLQKMMGYVPQQIFLTDDTIAANIAFGLDKNEMDQDDVIRAAKIANIHDFIMEELTEGYDTVVGEQGVRLSGGQRQRIGMARAMYHDPEIILLDEATSALDNLTEKAVMDAVHRMNKNKTVIIIAHRLSTIKECDEIFLVQKGEVLLSGTYAELYSKSDSFREMTLDENVQ
jgi:ABC-type multidrug transport system fused ATPase/permease subunit